ncbi:hypothetical protein cpbgf_1002880 [Cryptosporidium parvum]|uniref:Uncharacterized protein n=1 Tax=Cryptosporidium parvum TaxID=5807 RepID=F0X544_CRYPV|nr:Uncharacterized protein CPATCC_0036430 [Cryptosporidium parvum]WRK30684.1 hypothetical protein cpbgf_1002880 [Cryptosporidium parvum]|eukprot:QOY43337.1 hypothetical protein CPATCC_000115 [Cryptosporidium parvum]
MEGVLVHCCDHSIFLACYFKSIVTAGYMIYNIENNSSIYVFLITKHSFGLYIVLRHHPLFQSLSYLKYNNSTFSNKLVLFFFLNF